MQIPLHSYDLIDLLDELHPEVIYDPAKPKEEFLLRQGERRLILRLKALRKVEQMEHRAR
ncbi:hypothetical protein D7U98_08005 [Stenotrophomonas maltophilia]|jgi:hypothetical protein|uniref:Uncharacterized protein n=1 Tax=Stenotrophomonas maltophilia TaxID=40324 RepID=A0A6C8X4J3_STEMA|nr:MULTISPECIES: hypothetical protein [Stenotrophomonas]KDE88560.1 hypothetical protein DF40_008370 [Stenotrophomonas maltophilia M30]MCV4214466.1 hypothetical protein [Pseudomonas cichorii]CRR18270.1 hypothetical protein PAERUG_E15_London_28_01_14_08224 [Pseudomonas aeruginosa]AVH93437.1 hypothetical protein AL480_22585 [Stenotrophomonas maltophilia]EKT4066843.1 hypothetical protein [Stenotrophomonas maltophilia]